MLTPERPLYFDFRQSHAPDEHAGWGAENTLASVYRFDPLPSILSAAERRHILGVQGNVWSEYLITDDRVAWMIFPRAAALAEIGWSQTKRRDWRGFCTRLTAEFSRYEALGVPFDPEAYRVQSVETALLTAPNQTRLTLSNQVAAGAIRYTTDGSPVTTGSKLFDRAVTLSLPLQLRAAVFVESGSCRKRDQPLGDCQHTASCGDSADDALLSRSCDRWNTIRCIGEDLL